MLLMPFAGAHANEPKPYAMPRTQVVPIKDSNADREYELYIKLPESYDENADTQYPVIYTTDAKWHMDMLSGATEYLMPEVIVVGISWQKDLGEEAEHFSRFRDYSLIESTNAERQARYQFGQAQNHLAFLRSEVMAFVDQNYRTAPGDNAYFGYSLGGEFGAYVLITQPDTFNHYILGSPSVSQREVAYFDQLESTTAPQQQGFDANVFVSIGELEERRMEATKGFVSVLERRKEAGLALTGLEIIEDSDHGTAFPETAIRGVKWLSQLQSEFPVLEGPLMGQDPPGKTAEVFAPGVISTDAWELEAVFAPGMEEFYFVTNREGRERPMIIGFRFEDNRWNKFTEFPRTGEPFITEDGQTMHLAKGYRDRTATGWSDVKSLGPMFDREEWGIMRLTASPEGTYVFDDYKGGDVIRQSRMADGKREEPVELPEHINSGEWTAHPFIAPDESYLIWDSEREGGYGNSDLYISFRQEDGSWGPAINMGPQVNSDKDDFYASVTPDGKYLMFDRTISQSDDHTDVDIYWVDAGFIEELRPD